MTARCAPSKGFDSLGNTTVDIPDGELEDAMRYSKARTKREAIVLAIAEVNQRRRHRVRN